MCRTEDSEFGVILRANIDRLLKQRGWSTAEFCKRLGVRRQAYSLAFKGAHGPGMRKIHRWSRVLGVEMAELLKEDEG